MTTLKVKINTMSELTNMRFLFFIIFLLFLEDALPMAWNGYRRI